MIVCEEIDVGCRMFLGNAFWFGAIVRKLWCNCIITDSQEASANNEYLMMTNISNKIQGRNHAWEHGVSECFRLCIEQRGVWGLNREVSRYSEQRGVWGLNREVSRYSEFKPHSPLCSLHLFTSLCKPTLPSGHCTCSPPYINPHSPLVTAPVHLPM